MPTENLGSSPKKIAARLETAAAKSKTNSPKESHNPSQTQPPAQVGPCLYQRKPICPKFNANDRIKLRRWQRKKNHARRIKDLSGFWQ